MSNASRLEVSTVAKSTIPTEVPLPSRARRLLPFHWIEAAAVCSDLALIPITSLITGAVYDVAFLGGLGSIDAFLSVGVLTAINFSAILAARGSYRPQNLVNLGKQARETTIIWLFVFFVLSAVAFSFKITGEYSRGAILTFFVCGWVAIITWRFLMSRLIIRGLSGASFAEQKSLLIAQRGCLTGQTSIGELKRCGYMPVRVFEFTADSLLALHPGAELLRLVQEVVEATRQHKIRHIFLLASWHDSELIGRLMELLRVVAIPVYLLPDENIASLLGNRIVNIGTGWTAELKRAPLTTAEQLFKRGLDLLGASAALILLAPMMALVAILIKMDSRGPILFRQNRNGFSGRPFRIWKFRTMAVLEDGPVIRQVSQEDPRVTRLGRLLRRSNLDELPQLINVIAGDMSLIGPRPHALAHNSEYEKIISSYAYRYHVKPGLTGWAQVNGLRGETRTVDAMAKRVEFDLWYIDNWSLWLDLRILLRTLVLGLQPTAY
jgi:Undecaprenyl-phosphate glucose phosphotransferase